MEQMIESIAANLLYVIIGVCFLTGMGLKAVTTMVTSASQEKSRREIAAYIAEGSISPEQGERLMRADVNRGHRPCG